MRQAAQIKLGYYPAHPDAIAAIAKHLKLGIPKNERETINILDPCCGEGLAVRQLAQALGVPEDHVHGIELDAGRTEKARENLPNAQILGPASYAGVRVSPQSLGLAYVNPPFDDELGGGGREEKAFVEQVVYWLDAGGILVLVVPEAAIVAKGKFVTMLDARFEQIRVFQFPKHVRPYKELVIIGRKRKQALTDSDAQTHGCLHRMGMEWRNLYWDQRLGPIDHPAYAQFTSLKHHKGETALVPHVTYTIPPTWKPSTWAKVAYTDDELADEIKRSPLNKILRETKPVELARPPKPPGKGHTALLLASGLLDGLVESPEHGNHVVRGTAKKIEFYNEAASKSTEDAKGRVTTTDVYSQKVVLTIRAVWPDGTIQTFTDEPPAEAKDKAKAEPQGSAQTTESANPTRDTAIERARKLAKVTVLNGATAAEALNARDKVREIMDDWQITTHEIFTMGL